MNNLEDLTGKKFGRLEVIKKAPRLKSNTTRWECKCECGKIIQTTRTSLIRGHSKSCGCLAKELRSQNSKKYNKFYFFENYCIGYTSNTNKAFIIDKENYEVIKKYCWHESSNGYIATRIPDKNKIITLHRFIMGEGTNIVDHINGNRKDNTANNLRIVTAAQNCFNKGMQRNNKSRISGVYFDKSRNKWCGALTYNGKKHGKRFANKEDAIKYRKRLEEMFFKEYARTNSKI